MISSRTYKVALSLCLSILVVACGEQPSRSTPTAPPEVTPTFTPVPSITPAPTQTPVPPEVVLCAQLSGVMAQKLGLPFTFSKASFQDPLQVVAANPGCATEASGSNVNFANPAGVYNVMVTELQTLNWQQDLRYQSGGATTTASGFRNGERLCLATVNWAPSADANCPSDQSIETCELAPEQRIYTIKLECGESKILNLDRLVLSADAQLPDQPYAYLDLDSGAIGDVTNGDIKLITRRTTKSQLAVAAVNGATAYAAGEKDPGVKGCRRAQDKGSFTAADIDAVFAGSYICVTTDKANLVVVHFDEVSGNQAELSFTIKN